MSWALVADELAHLKADLAHEKRKARWAPYKGDPDRRCTAKTRLGDQCRAPRAKRRDGTLATTCRYHGGADVPLESRVRALRGLVALCEARLRGAKTKLALAELELKSVRDMGAPLLIAADSSEAANYPGPIDGAQQYQQVTPARQSEGQTSEVGDTPAGSDKVGPTER